MRKITNLDIEIYSYLRFYKSLSGGNSPTYRLIMEETVANSTSVVSNSLDKLQESGWIQKRRGYIRVVGDRWSCDHESYPRLGQPVNGL